MISSDEVKKLGLLARIEFSSKEADEIKKDLEAILDYVSALKEVATENSGSPAELKYGEAGNISNVVREDKALSDESDINKGEYFKVKHIL